MNSERYYRRTRALGITITVVGLVCLGSGVALLTWRVVRPDEAVLLLPGVVSTPEPTPTPGVLRSPVAPPPLPTDRSQLVILPISERPSPTPGDTPARATASLTDAPSVTASAAPTATASPTDAPTITVSVTVTFAATATATATAAATASSRPPTASPAPTLSPTPSPIPDPPAYPERILIDAIGLDAPVVPVGQHSLQVEDQVYSQWDVPDVFAAGWHQNSAPLGQPGNTVLNGHHNIHGEVFLHLVKLRPGDVVTLESGGTRYYYLVAQTMTLVEAGQSLEVRQENARWILPTDDERVTLITCWPYDSNTHRLVVIAMPPLTLGLPAEIP